MVENNMRIWDAVQTTDPKHTKKVEFGRKFTSIDAHWQVMQATKQFGPIGEGWGYHVQHSVERLTPEMILAVADVTIWWDARTDKGPVDTFTEYSPQRSYGPIRATCEMYGPKTYKGKPVVPAEFVTDEDAPKKAMTDALTKGLSHLGFSADVFLGKFDDNRYVQKVEREFANGPGSHATRSLEEARADIVAQTGNDKSTYELAKEKKEIATLKATAELAIGMAQTRLQLKDWWTQHRPILREKLSEDDYGTIVAMVEKRRDELPMLDAVA